MATRSANRLSNTVDELRRCNELLRVLTDDLIELLEEPGDRAARKWVLAVLDEMLDNLRRQFELEEHNDYLAEVLEQYPTWYPQVEHLRQQHALLHKQLRDIRERIDRGPMSEAVLHEARRQVRDWIDTYHEHQQREALLIQDAFTLETGAGE